MKNFCLLLSVCFFLFCGNAFAEDNSVETVTFQESDGVQSFILKGGDNEDQVVPYSEYEELLSAEESMESVEMADSSTVQPMFRLTPKNKCYCFQCGNSSTRKTGCSRLGEMKAAMDASLECLTHGKSSTVRKVGNGGC